MPHRCDTSAKCTCTRSTIEIIPVVSAASIRTISYPLVRRCRRWSSSDICSTWRKPLRLALSSYRSESLHRVSRTSPPSGKIENHMHEFRSIQRRRFAKLSLGAWTCVQQTVTIRYQWSVITPITAHVNDERTVTWPETDLFAAIKLYKGKKELDFNHSIVSAAAGTFELVTL